MFKAPVKTSTDPSIYTIKPKKRRQTKERNTISLVSGNKVRMQKETRAEEEVARVIKDNSKEWFGKEYTYEKIKACLKQECVAGESTKCLSAIYNKEVDTSELHKYIGSKISFISTIDRIEIRGKQITLHSFLDVIKIYKKECLDSRCLIEEECESEESCDDLEECESEISDDEVDIGFQEEEDFFEA